MSMFLSFIIFIGILVFVHEFGHFIIGKLFSIGVEIFSIGFGPVIISYKYKKTLYQICLIPLGGYVKFAGFTPYEKMEKKYIGSEFFKAAPWKKALIIFAGPFFNILLAFLIYFFIGWYGIEKIPAMIGKVIENYPAHIAGLKPGDLIKKINNQEIKSWSHMSRTLSKSHDKDIRIEFIRNDKYNYTNLKPILNKNSIYPYPKRGVIGISYGFSSPLISVINKKSIAHMLGLKTGDEIKHIEYNNKIYNIKYFYEIKEIFKKIIENPNDINIKYINKSNENKFINISKNRLTDIINQFDRKDDNKLGIYDSQLLFEKNKVYNYLISVEGQRITDLFMLNHIITNSKKSNLAIKYIKDYKIIDANIDLISKEIQGLYGPKTIYKFPINMINKNIFPKSKLIKYNLYGAFIFAIEELYQKTAMTISGIKDLIIGKISVKALGGPILIAKVANDSIKSGWRIFLLALAMISINLFLVNLLPVPVLDGGQLVLTFIEQIKGSMVSDKFIENYQKIGFIILFSLMIIAIYNDIARFWKSIINSIFSIVN